MKKRFTYLLFFSLLLGATSCQKEVVKPFHGCDGQQGDETELNLPIRGGENDPGTTTTGTTNTNTTTTSSGDTGTQTEEGDGGITDGGGSGQHDSKGGRGDGKKG